MNLRSWKKIDGDINLETMFNDNFKSTTTPHDSKKRCEQVKKKRVPSNAL